MSHITNQYESYYQPTPYPSPRDGAERLYHKAYKAYKSYKTYKSFSPLGGIEGG